MGSRRQPRAFAKLAVDYAKMLTDGMLLGEDEPFDKLIERCAAIEARANASQVKDR